ncbi:MAG: glycine cleavage system protein H [Chloroflexota bacterium]
MLSTLRVSDYEIPLDRSYHPESGCWVQAHDGRLTVGLDALTLTSYGDLVYLDLPPVGARLGRGEAFGSLEAGKFVGSLRCPVAGRVLAVNQDALVDPGLVNRDPYGQGWLLVLEVADPAGEIAALVQGEAIRGVFEERVQRYEREGILGED